MKDCKECRYGRWTLLGVNGPDYTEVRTCTECGASQVREVDVFPINRDKETLAAIEEKLKD